MQRDADDHLAERRARDRVSAAERLRTQNDVDAESAALPDDAVQQHRSALRNLVVLDEKFLELVNHQQRARHRLRAAGAFVAGDVLDAEFAEQIAAALEFVIQPLQHAEAEFAVAFDGHHARVRQMFAWRST